MADPKRLVDQCVHKGLMYLAESLQCYWPANFDPDGKYLHTFNENNIALHLARSFAEAGFWMWAEVPLHKQTGKQPERRLDFLAYSNKENITVALEFKKAIDSPPDGCLGDLCRLVKISESYLANNATVSDINDAEWIYGIVTVLYSDEFFAWWKDPASNDYRPESSRIRAAAYEHIGKAIAKAYSSKIVPLNKWQPSPARAMYAHTHAAYALFDATCISNCKSVLPAS